MGFWWDKNEKKVEPLQRVKKKNYNCSWKKDLKLIWISWENLVFFKIPYATDDLLLQRNF